MILPFNDSPEHISKLNALVQEWGDSFWNLDEILKTRKKSPTFLQFMIDTHSNWLGFIFALEQIDAFEILFIFTLSSSRRLGIAEKLITALQQEASKSQRKIFLEAKDSNSFAIALYEKTGFKRIQTRRKYYKDGKDAYIYEWC